MVNHFHCMSLSIDHVINDTTFSPEATSQRLTMDDHYKIITFLRDLNNNQLITLGGQLGLHHPSLTRMQDLPGDMAAAWLREEDNVLLTSGTPSWTSLIVSLETVGQRGIAYKIKQGECSYNS